MMISFATDTIPDEQEESGILRVSFEQSDFKIAFRFPSTSHLIFSNSFLAEFLSFHRSYVVGIGYNQNDFEIKSIINQKKFPT